MVEPISLQSVVNASTEQVSSDLAGEAVILNLQNGVYYGLDEVGARIWNMLQQPITVSAICDTLLEEYDAERNQIEEDVLVLLTELAEHTLIEVSNAPVAHAPIAG